MLYPQSLHHLLRKAYHLLTYSLSQESALSLFLSGETSAKTDRKGELSLLLFPHSATRNKVLAAGGATTFGQVVSNIL